MWRVEIGLRFEPRGTNNKLRKFLDVAYAELCRLDGLVDPEYSAVLQDHTVRFSALVKTADRHKATKQVAGAVRTALHTAGAKTPNWAEDLEGAFSLARVISEPAPALV